MVVVAVVVVVVVVCAALTAAHSICVTPCIAVSRVQAAIAHASEWWMHMHPV